MILEMMNEFSLRCIAMNTRFIDMLRNEWNTIIVIAITIITIFTVLTPHCYLIVYTWNSFIIHIGSRSKETFKETTCPKALDAF